MHSMNTATASPIDTTQKETPINSTPSSCSPATLWQVEEADREALEQERVAEWVVGHADPVTAALARAEAAEAEVARLRAGIEAIRDEAWEPWLEGDANHLDTVSKDCDALLSPPTEASTE